MTTMNVLDKDGATVAIEKPLAPGRAAASVSRPVALSNEDAAFLDGLETAIASTNTKLDTVITALSTLDGHVDGLEGFTDGLETAIAATNTLLTTQAGYLDGVEAAIASTNTKLDTLATDIVEATLPVGAGTAAAAGRTTLASDDPAVAALAGTAPTTAAKVITDAAGSVQQYLRGLIYLAITAAGVNVKPGFTSAGIVTLQSNATGTTYNAFASQACVQLTLVNDTGTDLEIQFGATGSTFILWSGASVTIPGITNASTVGYRRKDTSNTQVTLAAFWNS